jgi:hypothetical protein
MLCLPSSPQLSDSLLGNLAYWVHLPSCFGLHGLVYSFDCPATHSSHLIPVSREEMSEGGLTHFREAAHSNTLAMGES